MIVIDSSAVVAILLGEPTAPALLARLAAGPDREMLARWQSGMQPISPFREH